MWPAAWGTSHWLTLELTGRPTRTGSLSLCNTISQLDSFVFRPSSSSWFVPVRVLPETLPIKIRRKERVLNLELRVCTFRLGALVCLHLYHTPFPPAPDHLDDDDDSYSKMWTVCISQADKHDIARAERWKTDMDGILVFVSMPVFTLNASQALTLSNRSLDRCLRRDSGRIPHRKLQITQA
jgi:hypothetical protein